MKTALSSVIGAALFCLFSVYQLAAAHSEDAFCGRHDDVAALLDQQFHEHLTGMGIVNSKHFVEIFTSDKGTWTQLTTDTNHISCMTGAGKDWEYLSPAKQGDKT
jgi:hypothetical protein